MSRTQPYSANFRAKMIQKLSGPSPVSAAALSKQVGVSQTTLSRWLQDARSVTSMKIRPPANPSPPEPNPPMCPQDWTPEAKLELVAKALLASDEELGRLLRQDGVYEVQLKEWKSTMLASLRPQPQQSAAKVSRQVRALERELKRKDKALAETAALLVLRGKFDALWEDEGDDT